jgi:hypothetical protein
LGELFIKGCKPPVPPNPRKNLNGCLSAGLGFNSRNALALAAIKVFGKVVKPFFPKRVSQTISKFVD